MTTFDEASVLSRPCLRTTRRCGFGAGPARELLAAWACERMGLNGQDAGHYLQSIITAIIAGKEIEPWPRRCVETWEAAGAIADIAAIEPRKEIDLLLKLLGHSSITMTMDVYGHLFPRGDDSAELAKAERLLLGM